MNGDGATGGCDPFSWITAQSDRTEHAVTDEAQVAGMEAGHGSYEAVCGAVFLAAPMEVGPRGECSCCRAFLRARAELRDIDDRMGAHRPNWVVRLFSRPKHLADVGCSPAPTSAGPHEPSAGADCGPSEPVPAGANRKQGRHAA